MNRSRTPLGLGNSDSAIGLWPTLARINAPVQASDPIGMAVRGTRRLHSTEARLTMTFALLAGLATCTPYPTPTARSKPKPQNVEERDPLTPTLLALESTRDADWAPRTEQELLRRAGMHAPPLFVERVRCYGFSCRLLVRDTPNDRAPSPNLRQWLNSTWTFHWACDEVLERASKPASLTITLYRHPADRGPGQEPGFSSIRGNPVPACQHGADCSHRNWYELPPCDFEPCPIINLSGRSWCFVNMELACACLHSKGLEQPADFPCDGSERQDYAY